jgi:hypothetical protein
LETSRHKYFGGISKNFRIKACARDKNVGAQFIAPNQVNEHFVAGA